LQNHNKNERNNRVSESPHSPSNLPFDKFPLLSTNFAEFDEGLVDQKNADDFVRTILWIYTSICCRFIILFCKLLIFNSWNPFQVQYLENKLKSSFQDSPEKKPKLHLNSVLKFVISRKVYAHYYWEEARSRKKWRQRGCRKNWQKQIFWNTSGGLHHKYILLNFINLKIDENTRKNIAAGGIRTRIS